MEATALDELELETTLTWKTMDCPLPKTTVTEIDLGASVEGGVNARELPFSAIHGSFGLDTMFTGRAPI